MAERRYCIDCGAECQMTARGWRCPWATDVSRRMADDVLACGKPYERSRESLVMVREARKG